MTGRKVFMHRRSDAMSIEGKTVEESYDPSCPLLFSMLDRCSHSCSAETVQ